MEGLKTLFKNAVQDGVFPGVNICLHVKGKNHFESFGNKALFPEVEGNDIDTIYDLASVSKVISTTTCALKLMEMGKLRLYDNVSSIIPEFKYDKVVVWDLMTHTSGLPSDVHRSARLKDAAEAWEKIFAAEEVYPKNTKIVYSDIGYILLGKVIENVSGMCLNEFAKKYVFDPLEMYETGYNPTDVKRCAPTEKRSDEIFDGILRAKVHDEKAYILGGVAGHAGLFSTVKDLSHYIEMILNDGVYNGKRILSKPTIDLLYTPQVEDKIGVRLDNEVRGLGWIIKGNFCSAGDLCSKETILHTGYTGTSIFIDRINKIGLVMLSNRVHPTRENVKIIPFRAKLCNYVISTFGG